MGWGGPDPDRRATPPSEPPKRPSGLEQRIARLERWRRQNHQIVPFLGQIVPFLGMMAATAAALAIFWMASLPWAWTLEQRVLHLAAAPSCDFARRVGLAPARNGEPGYHSRHDFDNDGMACKLLAPGQIVIMVPLGTIAASIVRDRMRGASSDDVEP